MFPRGLPKEVIDVLFNATNKALADDGVQHSLTSNYEEVSPSASVEEFVKFARQEGEQGLRLAKASRQTAN